MSKKRVTADEIAGITSRGENVSAHFTNKFTVVRPIRRVSVDLTQGMLRALDERAARRLRDVDGGIDGRPTWSPARFAPAMAALL
jgi:hypothetical protein